MDHFIPCLIAKFSHVHPKGDQNIERMTGRHRAFRQRAAQGKRFGGGIVAAQQAGFEAWLIKTYLGCWKPAPQPADADLYIAQVRLAFNPDGSLAKPAKLVNPPSDPALKPQAKSVLAAVQNCNPLPVPTQYRPFYEQWKTKTIHFNPQVGGR